MIRKMGIGVVMRICRINEEHLLAALIHGHLLQCDRFESSLKMSRVISLLTER